MLGWHLHWLPERTKAPRKRRGLRHALDTKTVAVALGPMAGVYSQNSLSQPSFDPSVSSNPSWDPSDEEYDPSSVSFDRARRVAACGCTRHRRRTRSASQSDANTPMADAERGKEARPRDAGRARGRERLGTNCSAGRIVAAERQARFIAYTGSSLTPPARVVFAGRGDIAARSAERVKKPAVCNALPADCGQCEAARWARAKQRVWRRRRDDNLESARTE